MSIVILIFCPFEMKVTCNSLCGGFVSIQELQIIIVESTQLLVSIQSLSFFKLLSWLSRPSDARKLSINGPVASKFWLLTNSQNLSSSVLLLLSFLHEKSVKLINSTDHVTKIVLFFMLVFLNGYKYLATSK